MKGLILKGIGGFYYVKTLEGIFSCKARGLFRKEKISPYPGDMVEILLTHEGDKEAYIEKILPRKNIFIRPPLVNVDKMFIVVATASPAPQTLMIDKTIAICEKKKIEPVIVLNKIDLADGAALEQIYKDAGFTVILSSAIENRGTKEIISNISGNICVFAGHSGVGKSSIINSLIPDTNAEVGELSVRLERGKHTTRHVELFPFADGYIADTPGFGDISTERFETVYKDDLEVCFREFGPFVEKCRFAGCAHYKEPDCAVKAAVKTKEISQSRYKSYVSMYEEVMDIKDWEINK